MPAHAAIRVFLVGLVAVGVLGCESMTYDEGEGPVNSRGQSVGELAEQKPGDLEFETENPSLPVEEEAYDDAVEDAER